MKIPPMKCGGWKFVEGFICPMGNVVGKQKAT